MSEKRNANILISWFFIVRILKMVLQIVQQITVIFYLFCCFFSNLGAIISLKNYPNPNFIHNMTSSIDCTHNLRIFFTHMILYMLHCGSFNRIFILYAFSVAGG